MRKAYHYRIYLTNGQTRILNTTLEECRWVYNQTLAARRDAFSQGVSLSWYETKAMLPSWKEARPSLKLVHSQVLQNVTQRVDLAFQAFFRRVKEGADDPGYPRFKGFGRYDSITYPQYGNGVEIRGNDLVVSKIGRLKVVWHRSVEGQIKTVTLRRARTLKWYVSFSVEVERERLSPSAEIVGVDLGLMSFATLSNGEQIDNPRFYRTDEADLKRAQKLKDAAKNAQKWDENRHRKKAVAHIYERIANRRSDFAHKRSRELVNRYQVIVFEELAPQHMGARRGRGMRKSIMDVVWSQFVEMTIGKAEEAGRTVILVNPCDTSKMCSQCDELVEKKLSERTHTCPQCGLVMDRDRNAALNILQRGLQTLRL
jgi:putative transposase